MEKLMIFDSGKCVGCIEEMVPIGLPLDADAVLLFEVDGIPEAIEKEAAGITALAKQYGAREVRLAKDQSEADQYWNARKAGFAATFLLLRRPPPRSPRPRARDRAH